MPPYKCGEFSSYKWLKILKIDNLEQKWSCRRIRHESALAESFFNPKTMRARQKEGDIFGCIEIVAVGYHGCNH